MSQLEVLPDLDTPDDLRRLVAEPPPWLAALLGRLGPPSPNLWKTTGPDRSFSTVTDPE